MQNNIRFLLLLCVCLFISACGAKQDSAEQKNSDKKGIKPTLVTTTQVKKQALEVTEEAVGTLEGLDNPTVSAEVAGRVVKIYVNTGETVKQGKLLATLDPSDFDMQRKEAQAEVARLEALLANQAKTVERNQALVSQKFISQNAVDNEIAQQSALKEQLTAAKARVGSINHNSSKTRIYAPATGNVEKKLTDEGNFVKVGDPVMLIVSRQHLRAHLAFPEHIAAKLKPGLEVRLSSPTSDTAVKSTIHELKPMIVEGSRSVDVIADVIGAPDWQPGASVTGSVVLAKTTAAMMVPEQSVVLRPAGEVVYIVRNNKAFQAIVKTGIHQNGLVEILAGLHDNDNIVVDGAGFLTDNALIKEADANDKAPQKTSSKLGS